MIAAIAFVVSFVAMEGVSYAAHRWLMHGTGMVWHASHHAPPRGRFERNDLFPVCFSVLGIALFAVASAGLAPGWVWWSAAGITAYGVAYLTVHEIVIHRRVRVRLREGRYLRWLRDSHHAHHVDGGEPFGMLLPLMSRRDRARVPRRGSSERHDALTRTGSGRMGS
ncbi:MAG: sterol desaturase family protein [Ilumatobacteraceae bacterium]